MQLCVLIGGLYMYDLTAQDVFCEGVDVLLTPTTVSSAPLLSRWKDETKVNNMANDIFTVPASLSG